jgi:RNA polymerase sigma factor (sigma-70 family)
MEISEQTLDKLRAKLRFKAQYHLGWWCADLDDIVQETMVRLLRAEREGLIRSPDAWAAFASATCNNVIHEYRRRLWRDASEQRASREPQSASESYELETRDLVQNIIAQLPTRDQLILRAFYLDEKTIDQICVETGISRVSFRVALFRAKKKFREKLHPPLKPAGAGSH